MRTLGDFIRGTFFKKPPAAEYTLFQFNSTGVHAEKYVGGGHFAYTHQEQLLALNLFDLPRCLGFNKHQTNQLVPCLA